MSSITPSKLIRSRTSRRYVTLRTTLFFVAAFHTALKDGAADEILDSLRSSFDKAAQAFTQARTLIPADQPAEASCTTRNPKPSPHGRRSTATSRDSTASARSARRSDHEPETSRSSTSTRSATASASRTARSFALTAPTSRPTAPRSAAPAPPPHHPVVTAAGAATHRRLGAGPLPRVGQRPVGTPARRTGGLRPRRKRPNARTAAAEKPL